MRIRLHNVFLFFILWHFTSACNWSECKNTHPTFDKFTPDAQEYKVELAKQLEIAGPGNLFYSFDSYLVRGVNEFIVVHIQGAGLCAKAELEVKDWSKLSGMRKEISGYRGANLVGLKIAIKQDSTGTNLIYQDIERIID